MILKQAFIVVLFLTVNLCAETASGILVQHRPGPTSNSFSTSEPPTNITLAEKTIHHTVETTKGTPLETTSHDNTPFNATVSEPVRINHNRTTKQLLQNSTVTTPSTTVPYVSTLATNIITNTPVYDRSSSHKEDVVTQQTKPASTSQDSNNGKSMTMEDKSADSKTTAAGIVAVICVGFALTFFISLVAFRFIHKKRHGNREILINEEDVDFNGDDLRHFEATCIQLEPEDA